MRSTLIILLSVSTAFAGPVTVRQAPTLGGTSLVVPALGLPAASPLSLGAPVLPSLQTALPALTLAPEIPAPLAPTPILRRAAIRVRAVPAPQGERKEPLLRRLSRGFKNALSLPSIYDNAHPAALNGADDASGYRLGEKPDRRSPRLAQRDAFELKQDVESLYAGLREIHDLASRKGDAVLTSRKAAFLQRLETVSAGIEAASVIEAPYKTASKRLKQLHTQRDALEKDQAEAAKNENGARLDALNETAIALQRSMLKTQLGVAILQLKGKSLLPSKASRRNAAIWTLSGAYNTAAALEAEVRYSVNRQRVREKRREYLTRDALGRPVRVFNLEGFDIEVLGPLDGGKPVVTIRQQRWRNVLTHLADAARDVRNGRPEEALAKLATILSLYTVEDGAVKPEVRRDYALIANALAEARDAVSRRSGDASDKIEAVAELLSYPKLSSWKDVEYQGLDKALRSQIHTLTGNLDETTRVLRNLSELDYWHDLLSAAMRPQEGGAGRPLSQRERARMGAALQSILLWAGRGKVRPKQEAAAALSAAAAAVDRGDLVMARERLRRAHGALQQRVKDLDSISENVRRRAAALYAEYRDTDLLARTAIMLHGALKMADTALALKEEYDLDSLPEPGYRRAARALDAFAQAARRGEGTAALRLLETAREDIKHKRSLRVTIRVRPSKTSKRHTVNSRFVNPGTTLRTVVGRTGGRRDTPDIRIDGGPWQSGAAIDWGLRLSDESVVELVYPSR